MVITSTQLCLRPLFNLFLSPLPPGGPEGGSGLCFFTSEAGVLGRIRGVFFSVIFMLTVSTVGINLQQLAGFDMHRADKVRPDSGRVFSISGTTGFCLVASRSLAAYRVYGRLRYPEGLNTQPAFV